MNKRPEAGSSFRPAFFFLPKTKYRALSAVYAFCRAVDDAVDEPGPVPPREAMTQWRERLDRLYAGAPDCDITRALAAPIAEFGLKKEHFLLVIEGMEMDIATTRYATLPELDRYMYRVAGAVGLLCVSIFAKAPAQKYEAYAELTGNAVQLTNILRDIAEDSARGRIYLPLEDLRHFGVAEGDVLSLKESAAMRRLLTFECGRARTYYASALASLYGHCRRGLLPAQIMACVYAALLAKMEKDPQVVLRGRLRLGAAEKICCIFKAWRQL